MANHKEVVVKVNVYVDEGIADLIVALSGFEGLMTLESCQGEPGEADAFVLFRHGDWRQCGQVLFEDLMPSLKDDLRSQVSLRLESFDDGGAMGSILLAPEAIEPLTEVVRQVLSKTKAQATEQKPASPALDAAAAKPAPGHPASTAAQPAVPEPTQPAAAPVAANPGNGVARGLPAENPISGAGT